MSQIPLSPEFMRGLEESEATYRHLAEGIPAILYLDANDDLSTNLYTSPQIERILGFTAEEWRANPALWLLRLHEDDRERVLEETRRCNETGEPFHNVYRLLAADGRVVWLRDDAVLVRNEDGEPMFWRGIMLDITEQKRAEEKLKRSLEVVRRSAAERRALLVRLEEAQEEERRRIAADIHDDSIQVITAADLRLSALKRTVDDPELLREVEQIHETLRLAADRLRQLLFELHPPALDQEGLAAAIRTYLSDRDPGLEFTVDDRLQDEPPAEVRTILFRIAQEAVSNALKHAGAGRLDVLVASEDRGIKLRVADDGKGFEAGGLANPAPGHIGLPTMVERAELAGGWCRVDSKPGGGTTVEVWIPLAEAEPSGGEPFA